MLKKEFEFILQDSLVYSHDGKAGLQAKRLLLRAPSTRYLVLASKLSSIIMGALMKARESFKSDEQNKSSSEKSGTDLDGEGIYMLISSSLDSQKTGELIALFTDLILSKDICLVDGKEPLTNDLLDTLDSRETLRLVGDYIANFLLPSTMANSKKKN